MAAVPVAGQVEVIPRQARQEAAGGKFRPSQSGRNSSHSLDGLGSVLLPREGGQLMLNLIEGRVRRREGLGVISFRPIPAVSVSVVVGGNVLVGVEPPSLQVEADLFLGGGLVKGEGAEVGHSLGIGTSGPVVLVVRIHGGSDGAGRKMD